MSVTIYRQTGGFFQFDFDENEGHRIRANVTKHPVEYAAPTADHVQKLPREFTMRLVVTETPIVGIQPIGLFGLQRVLAATKFLEECIGEKLIVETAKDGQFLNCLLESIDYNSTIVSNRVFDLAFTQIQFSIAQLVQIPPSIVSASSKSGASSTQNLGQQATTATTAPQTTADTTDLLSLLYATGVL